MTCIVAARDEISGVIWVASERLNTDGAGCKYFQVSPKIKVFNGIIYATCGSVRAGSVAERSLVQFIGQQGEHCSVEAIKEGFGDHLYPIIQERVGEAARDFGMLLVVEGRVLCLDDTCEVLEASGPWAIGCGGNYALGFLFGQSGDKQSVTQAVEAAIEYDANCGGIIDVIDSNTGVLQQHIYI